MKKAKLIRLSYSLLAAVLVMTFLCCETKDPVKEADQHNDAKFSSAEEAKNNSHFLVDAAGLLLQDIELAKLAQNNSIKKDVRKTGQRLEFEYTQAYSKLKQVASKKTITLPAEVSSSDKKTDSDISYEISDKFDDKYFELSKKDHEEAISLLGKIKDKCSHADIREWAGNTLTLYRNNADSLLTLEKKLALNKPNP